MGDWAHEKARALVAMGLFATCVELRTAIATALREAEARGYERGLEDAAKECAFGKHSGAAEIAAAIRAKGRTE